MSKWEEKQAYKRTAIHQKITDGSPLTNDEKVTRIDEKYEKKEPLTFDEFKFIFLELNWDVCFLYKGIRYEIVHGTQFCKNTDPKNNYSNQEVEEYMSNEDLFLNARLGGKNFEEIWNEVIIVS